MKLGNAGHIVIGSKSYNASLEFMKNLYTKSVAEGTSPERTRFAMFTDGRANFFLDETSFEENYSGLIYFNTNISEVIPVVEELGLKIHTTKKGGEIVSILFENIDGLAINIINKHHPENPEPIKSESTVIFGKFGEFAIHVENLDISLEHWEKLGFKALHKDKRMQYAILYDGVFVIGIHEHKMDKSGLTYFHKDMKSVLPQLKERGIEFDENHKMTSDMHKVAYSPCGQAFYFFTGQI